MDDNAIPFQRREFDRPPIDADTPPERSI